tara:strand:+ start:782 stop:1270 length:489 start_codon:yes stop_codon:yes gene_type:complete
MDSRLCGQLLAETLAATRAKLSDLGLGDFAVTQSGRATFDDTSFVVKIEIREKVVTDSGVEMTKEATDLLQARFALGMSKSDLGRVISTPRRGDVQIIGYRRRARKFPILVKVVSTGDRVCFRTSDVVRMLEDQHGALDERGGEFAKTPVLTEIPLLLGGAK